jgi:hypothetical protein
MTRGSDAVELRRRWQAHSNADGTAKNTLFAVFGISSALGRFADTSAFRNSPYAIWLEDIAYRHGVAEELQAADPPWSGFAADRPRSAAAAAGRRARIEPSARTQARNDRGGNDRAAWLLSVRQVKLAWSSR